MANLGSPQNWPSWPYEGSKDCSQGFCSIYCPQWCYIIFPPPPPFELADDSPSGPAFSPLIIAIIGIIASAFLLVTYYTIISRYCGRLDFLHRRLHRHAPAAQPHDEPDAPSGRHEGWHFSASNGLDEALISKISVYRYKRDEGVIDGTDCSVCLSEFQEDESLRLLPKCSHAFHVHCIDMWLRSHSNCPLCRANIVSASPAPPPLPLLPPPPEPQLVNPPASSNGETNDEVVVIIEEDCIRTAEEEAEGEHSSPLENERDAPKDSSLEEEHLVVEIGDHECQAVRRSFSMDSSHRVRMSIADVLRSGMDDEFLVATKDHSFTTGAGSSRYGKGSSRSRVLHCGMSPVPMKRSFSSGRFCFTRQARGRNSVLPL